MSLDLGPAIRAALQAETPIASELAVYAGVPAVFAFRPIPSDVVGIYMIVNPDSAIGDMDALTSDRPMVIRDIAIYGPRGAPGDPADASPAVEALGYLVRELFHRKKFSVRPTGYSVMQITAAGPVPAPVDDDQTVGRMVSLTIWLRRTS